jgi:hypothetical protein
MAGLIELQLEVLLARDAHGRLTATRDPEPRSAPRVFLGRSAEGNAFAVHADVDAGTRIMVERLLADEPPLARPDPDDTPRCRERILSLLAPIATEFRGPAFVLPEDLPRDDRAREVEEDPRGPWLEAFPWLGGGCAALAPVVIAFEGGEPAAVCHSPRGCTDAVAEAGVETLERFRGRGLGSAAVACWARAVQRSGRRALYSTSWENAASRALARRLSARLYGENWHVT